MRKIGKQLALYFLLMLGLCIGQKAYCSEPFPCYFEVVSYFFSNYSKNSDIDQLRFEKDKEGWKVYISEWEKQKEEYTEKRNLHELLWNAKTGRFVSLQKYIKKIGIEGNEQAYKYGSSNNHLDWYSFDRVPYFGYESWYLDVIKDFANKENKSDTLLEALARAYSQGSSDFLWNQYGINPNLKDPLRIPLSPFQMPDKEKVNAFIEWQDQAIRWYKELLIQNTQYQTFVGNIAVKYFNELFYTYHALNLCNQAKEAEKYLNQCEIPEYYLNTAKNYLNSLAENAILFTNGDNDTFPLCYLQDKMNFRIDVTIINRSLLNSWWYIQSLQDRVVTTTPSGLYAKTQLIYIQKSVSKSKEEFTVGNILSQLGESIQEPIIVFNASDSVCIHTNNYIIKYDLGRYITTGELLMLDIIQSNINNHPVYFCSKHNNGFSESYFIPEGIVFRLVENMQQGQSWAAQQDDYFQKTFNKEAFNKKDPSSFIHFYAYLSANISLYTYYKETENTGASYAVIQSIIQLLNQFDYGISDIYSLIRMVDFALENDFLEAADRMEKRLMELVLQKINTLDLDHIPASIAKYYLEYVQTFRVSHQKEVNPKITQLIQTL